MSLLWRCLDDSLRVVATGKAIQVRLETSRPGRLCIGCHKGAFPEGELALIISNWPQTRHWLVPARLEQGVLIAELAGSQAAFDPEDPRPLPLALAVRSQQGLIQYPLRARRLLTRMNPSNRCAYFFDRSDLFAGPADRFEREGQVYEAVPRFVQTGAKVIAPAVQLTPRSLRYWDQFTYGLIGLDRREDGLYWRAAAPHGAPELLGLSLHRPGGDPAGQQFFPFEGEGDLRRARMPLDSLPMDGEEYALSGVVAREGDVLFHVPVCVNDKALHQRLDDLANGIPLRQSDGVGCYLLLDFLCHPTLIALSHRPNRQRDIPAGTLMQALEQDLLPELGHCSIRDLGGNDWHWKIQLPNFPLSQEDEVMVIAALKQKRCFLPVTACSDEEGGSLLCVDLSPMIAHIQNSRINRWDLTLAIHQGQDWYHLSLRCPARMLRRRLDIDPEFLDYTAAFGAPLGSFPMGDHAVDCLISCLSDGICRLQTEDPLCRYQSQFLCRVDDIRLMGRKLSLRLRCPAFAPGRWTGIALAHRYKLELDRELHFFPAKQVEEKDGVFHLTATADLSALTFSPLYWDLRAVFQGEDGKTYLVRVTVAITRNRSAKERAWLRRKRRIHRTLFSDSYRQGKELSVSLYRTADHSFALVCQEYSPYSGLFFRMKERLAVVLARLFRRNLAKKSIFLCYEKYCCMAQDNGFYFFRHCMEHEMERKMHRSIYFVIDKKQPDYKERLLPYRDHVIQFMSLRHMVYLLASRLLISSDSKAHAYAWRAKESIILPRVQNTKKLVFLQHGVIALKRVEFYSKGTNAVQLFITSNQREHDIIVEEMAYPTEDVVITGLARWDVLEDRGLAEKHILVMPTWRNWLEEVSDAAFMSSDYYQNYMSLLNDPRLAELLEQQDLYLDFYIHPKFRDYMSDFSISGGGRVRLIPFGAEPLNQLIMGCKLLITDYSSVCWDVYYQGKPVLFYQFDLEQYNETTGSYIDMETELFGDRVLTTQELLSALEEYAVNDFRLPEKYARMRPGMYAYLDHNNSQRVCEEIMKRHW